MKKRNRWIAAISAAAIAALFVFAKDERMEKSKVYFTRDISPAGLAKAYKALGRRAEGKVAVKISTGEPGGHNFLAPGLIKELVRSEKGTIVECNTGYGGRRADTASHKKAAADHGFAKIAKVDIMDEDGEVALPIARGRRIKQDYVGSHFQNYDYWIVLSHFKGHQMGGFGGALKNISIGIASAGGKLWIHSAGATKEPGPKAFGAKQNYFLDAMADAAAAVVDSAGRGNMAYINVLNNLSVDCDCNANPAPPEMEDIGIMSSLDPVALDRASVDAVYNSPDAGKKHLIERIESKNGTRILDAAEKLGLGAQSYELIDLDK
jgi:uncharacterized Fe-S center protein